MSRSMCVLLQKIDKSCCIYYRVLSESSSFVLHPPDATVHSHLFFCFVFFVFFFVFCFFFNKKAHNSFNFFYEGPVQKCKNWSFINVNAVVFQNNQIRYLVNSHTELSWYWSGEFFSLFILHGVWFISIFERCRSFLCEKK